MGGAASVEELTERVKGLEAALVAAKDRAAELNGEKDKLNLTQITIDLGNIRTNGAAALDLFGDLARKLNEAQDAADAFSSAFHSLLDIQAAIADGYRERPDYKGNAGANDPKYVTQVGAMLQRIISTAQQVGGGENNALGGLVMNVLKELQGGIITPDEAIRVVQGLLSGLEGGILQDIGNAPTMAARNFAAALERFIHGGLFQ